MGSGEIGIPTLRWLAGASGHEVIGVFTQPDKPAGRKSVLTPPPIKVVALELGLPVFQPVRLRRREAAGEVAALGADIIVVMAYGQILPKAVLEAPRLACLNLHASILPLYRGAAPIQAAILAGDRETGLSVMYMDEGLDTGDVLLIETLEIAADETGGSLHDRLAQLGPAALENALGTLESGGAPRRPQDDALASHVGKLTRDDGRIDWSRPADEIERLVRAYDPWPGTLTTIRKLSGDADSKSRPKNLKILPPTEIEMVEAGGHSPGHILHADKRGILVATGDPERALLVKRVQPESKKQMDAAAFLAGRPFGDRATLR